MSWKSDLLSKLPPIFIFTVLYLLFFELTIHIGWESETYAGVYLLYFPAGIRLIASLVSGFWGTVGIAITTISISQYLWPDHPTWFYVVYGLLGAFSTLIAVNAMKRILKIDSLLTNLKLLHLPCVDLGATLFHALVLNVFLMVCGKFPDSDTVSRTLAMTVGDFNGGIVILLGLALFLKVNTILHVKI